MLPDSNLAHRLEAVERAIVGLAEQKMPDHSVAPLLSALQALSHRLEVLEKVHVRTSVGVARGHPMFNFGSRSRRKRASWRPGTRRNQREAPDFEDIFAQA